jgi:hypothetical protein
MKSYEKELLNSLQTDQVQDIPLQNVRKALGSIAYAVGNPLSKTEISLLITLQFFNTGVGAIQPIALAVPNQTSLPVYLFGLTDFYGGYSRLLNIIAPRPPWVYLAVASGIVGYQGLVPFPGFFVAPVAGDMVLQYIAPDGVGFQDVAQIIIHCNNVAYGTFLNSFVSDLITIDLIRYFVPAVANINQFENPLIFGTQSLFGKVKTDSLDPRVYQTSKNFQNQIADIPINLPIDKTLMCGFQLDVFCPGIAWTLFVKKVEPLTHKV